MKKKILFISPLPPPHYGSAMSSEMCLKILSENNNFEVRNIKLNYSKKMGDVGKFNMDKLRGFFKVRNEIKKMIKNFSPDIIYFVPATSSWGFQRDYFFWKQIRRFYFGEIIFHLRSRVLEKDWKMPNFRKKLSKMFKGQRVIILGNELMRDLHGLVSEENIFILPNAIKNEISQKDFNEIIEERKKTNGFNLLFLSNMNLSKGWMKLLKACEILKNRKIDFHCNFVGDFPSNKEKTLFFNFVKEKNLSEYISYLGKKTGKDKNKILEMSDILIFPTEYPLETFGRVIIEGMMFGLPVIANGLATIPSIISDGKSGFVLKENSPKEIVNCIMKLKDEKIREKFGKEGRKIFLSDFELNAYKKKFTKIFNSV